jgi:peroxiredoxin
MKRAMSLAWSLVATLLALVVTTTSVSAEEAVIAPEAKTAKPIAVGVAMPKVTVKSAEGESIELSSLHKDGPVVIVFFRGGWCPICSKHTAELAKIQPQLKKFGATMVGISPDDPTHSRQNIAKNSIPFPILSDSEVAAAKAFGLAFRVDDETVKKYQGFGIDLEKASGKSHHALPVPAVFIVDRGGKIIFAHSDPDYRQRLEPARIVEALAKSRR